VLYAGGVSRLRRRFLQTASWFEKNTKKPQTAKVEVCATRSVGCGRRGSHLLHELGNPRQVAHRVGVLNRELDEYVPDLMECHPFRLTRPTSPARSTRRLITQGH